MTGITKEPSRRERKKIATTEAIARAALSFAEERGLSDTTVEMIAGAADVSYRTFFNYFSSKEEAALWLGSSLEKELTEFILNCPQENAMDTVTALAHAHVMWLERYKDVLKMRGRAAAKCGSLRSAMQAQIHGLDNAMADAFAKRLDAKPDAIEPFLASRCAASLIEMSARSVIAGKSQDEVHQLIDESADLLRNGLRF